MSIENLLDLENVTANSLIGEATGLIEDKSKDGILRESLYDLISLVGVFIAHKTKSPHFDIALDKNIKFNDDQSKWFSKITFCSGGLIFISDDIPIKLRSDLNGRRKDLCLHKFCRGDLTVLITAIKNALKHVKNKNYLKQ